MISLQKREKGFTIIELLIVIVVIGILAAIVITTFSGIQRKARDSERTTDINAIHGQLEAYFTTNGYYPTLANLSDDGWVGSNLPGLDVEALRDPQGSGGNDITGAIAEDDYAYVLTNPACDNGAGGNCDGYTLTATLEAGGTHAKSALN